MTSSSRRVRAGILCGVLAAALVPAISSSPTAQALSPGVAFSAEGLSTWQTNGIVWALGASQGKVVAGGTFTQLRPPAGSTGTTQTVPGLAILDGETGAPDSCQLPVSFADGSTASVRAITTSDDGKTVYVAGNFGRIDGQNTGRIAAIDVATCAVKPFRVGGISSFVQSLAVRDNTLYLAGDFTSVAGETRQRFAAVDATTGDLLPWAPAADAPGRGLGVSPDGSMVAIGGDFFNVNGTPTHSIAVVDAVNGAIVRAYSNGFIPNNSATKHIFSGEDRFYVSNEGTGGGVFDGRLAISWSSLDQEWRDTCLGATQATLEHQGTLYSASHAHDCSSDGSQDGYQDGKRNYFNAQDAASSKLLGWDPKANDGIGEGIGPRALTTVVGRTTGKTYLWSGGEFTQINGAAQQGLTRFGPDDNDAPPATSLPVVKALSEGGIQVRWRSVVDPDDSELTYTVFRNGGSQPVWQATSSSVWWKRPQLSFVDTDVVPGTSYTYRVRVSDGNSSSPLSSGVAAVAAAPSSTYASVVRGDAPSTYLDMEGYGPDALWMQEVGATTSDARRINGLFVNYPTRLTDSPIPGDTTGSVRLNGTSQFGWTDEFVPGPSSYSIETWVKTTTTRGGLLVGYGNGRPRTDSSAFRASNSGKFDRLLYLEDSGFVRFGAGSARATIRSNRAVNDGQWHHLVATQDQGGMALYVDGSRVARTAATSGNAPLSYNGGWHYGAENLSGWTSKPTSNFFAGQLDEVAIYPAALPRTAVANHYRTAGGTITVTPRPTDSYGGAVYDDDPDLYWRLGESSGTVAADSSYTGDTRGTYQSGVTKSVTGIPSQSGTGGNRAVTTPGTTTGTIATQAALSPSQVFSAEVWFRTTTTRGGKIIGFENTATGSGSSYDKQLYMQNNGRLTFGIYGGQVNTISSPQAYNDGSWHHAVAGVGPNGQFLHVDGQQVATGTATASETGNGYWRLGGGNLSSWPDRPTSDYFAGTIDEAAVYSSALSLATSRRHYALGVADTQAPTAPTDLSALQADGEVTVRWAASTDNVGVQGYRVYRGLTANFVPDATTLLGSTTTTTFTHPSSAGSFFYKVVADDPVPNSSAPSAALRVDVLDREAPTRPTGVAASVSGPGAVTVTWTPSSDNVAVTGYQVHRGATADFTVGGGTLIGTTGPTSTFGDTDVPQGQVFYKVVARDDAGNTSPVSDPASVTVADYRAPSVPTGVSAVASGNGIALAWTASTDDVGVADYRVYRGASAGFTVGAATLVDTVTTASYTDNPPASGTYYYRVVARDAAGNASDPSAEVSSAATLPDTTPPSVVDGVTSSVTGASVSLSWAAATDNVGVTGYRVYRGTTAGFTPAAGNRVGEVATTSFTDERVPLGTHFYKVEAFDAAGNVSAASAATRVELGATKVVLEPVADARIHSGLNTRTFGTDVQLAATGGTTPLWSLLRFDLPQAPAGTTLSGVEIELRTSGDPTAGSVDEFDIVVTGNGWSESSVTWDNRPTQTGARLATLRGATGVDTAYRLVGDPTALAGSVGSPVSLRLSGPQGANDNLRLWSREAAAIYRPTLTLTFAPGGDSAAPSVPDVSTAVAGSNVTLSWPASTDNVAVAGYTVHRGTSAGFVADASSRIADVSTTSYADLGRGAGTWFYKVVAYDAAGNRSAPSAASSATVADTTAPTVPGSVQATQSGDSQVAVTWTASTDDVAVAQYRIHRGTTAGFTVGAGSLVGTSATASFTDTPPAAGTYFYRVVARDAAGNDSDPSAAASVSLGGVDTVAPTVPASLESSVSGASVSLSWTASTDNTAVTGYRVYRGATAGFTPAAGNRVGTPAGSSYTDVAPVGTHFYKVEAVDAAGNVSAASAAVRADVSGTEVVLEPLADARVHSVLTNRTFGTDVQLAATGGGSASLESFLRFQLPQAPAGQTLTGVTVTVRTSNDPTAGTVDPYAVHLVTGAWDESTVTWLDRPTDVVAKLADLTGLQGVNTPATSVGSPAVLRDLGGQAVTLRIAGPTSSQDNLRLWSREGPAGYAPTLTLTYS
jgi:large repetitive protein